MVRVTGRTIPAGDFTACGKTDAGSDWSVRNESSPYDSPATARLWR